MKKFKVKTNIPYIIFRRAMSYALRNCAGNERQVLLGIMYGLNNGEKEFDIAQTPRISYYLIGQGFKIKDNKVKIVWKRL